MRQPRVETAAGQPGGLVTSPEQLRRTAALRLIREVVPLLLEETPKGPAGLAAFHAQEAEAALARALVATDEGEAEGPIQ